MVSVTSSVIIHVLYCHGIHSLLMRGKLNNGYTITSRFPSCHVFVDVQMYRKFSKSEVVFRSQPHVTENHVPSTYINYVVDSLTKNLITIELNL